MGDRTSNFPCQYSKALPTRPSQHTIFIPSCFLFIVAKISNNFASRQRQRDNFRIISDNEIIFRLHDIVVSAQLWKSNYTFLFSLAIKGSSVNFFFIIYKHPRTFKNVNFTAHAPRPKQVKATIFWVLGF